MPRTGLLSASTAIALAGSALLPVGQAHALTETQVLERLQGVPVFAITDDKGAPLLGGLPNQPNRKPGEPTQVMLFFLNPEDAQATLAQVRKNNPQIGNRAQVAVRSMNDAFKVIRENKDRTVSFQFIASRPNLEAARTLLTAGGKPPTQLPSVPVFFAVGGQGNNEGLLTMTFDQNGKREQVVPFFFDRTDLQNFIDRAKKDQPALAQTTRIQVTNLFSVLDSMVTKPNERPNPDVQRFQFVPARGAFEYAVKNQPKPPNATTPR